ncbi:MAG: group II intron reverse transcriptase/maturase [Bacteroidota bacterium]
MSVSDGARVVKGNRQQEIPLMEQLVSSQNMRAAYERVYSNNGSAGIDGMTVGQLKSYLQDNWLKIKSDLLASNYYPQGVKSEKIPKANGGERELGIPTVVDRLIQQALHQVLSPLYEPDFSDHSYGFRPKRSAHQALRKAQDYIREDKRYVVDIDLSKFFDEVHHNRLLSKLRMRVEDKRVIHLIDRYLRAGMMRNGVEEKRMKGTPQGSPLSPLLSNIVLDELDKELESRGLSFVRYADDFQIYVRTKRSADRVMTSVSKFIDKKLRLKVNEKKSAVGRPWNREFLGYSFTTDKAIKLKPSKTSLKRLKGKVKEKFRKGKGRNLGKFIRDDLNPLLKGWINYFSLSETCGFAKEMDSWLRRRLRKVRWQQWKRSWTRFKELMRRGLSEERSVQSAFNKRGPWWNAGTSHMNQAYPKQYFDKLGLTNLEHQLNRQSR